MMQVIIRRLGETLYIGDDIEITILAIKDNQVRLGVNTPKSFPVRRAETPRDEKS